MKPILPIGKAWRDLSLDEQLKLADRRMGQFFTAMLLILAALLVFLFFSFVGGQR